MAADNGQAVIDVEALARQAMSSGGTIDVGVEEAGTAVITPEVVEVPEVVSDVGLQVEPEASVVPPETPDAKPSLFRDYMVSKGYKDFAEDADDDASLSRLEDVAQRAFNAPDAQEHKRLRVEADYWRQLAESKEEVVPQKTPDAEVTDQKTKWVAPQRDPAWEGRVKRDQESGRFIPATQYDSPEAANAANKYEEEVREFNSRLVSDPVGLMKDVGFGDYIDSQLADFKKNFTAEFQSSQNIDRHQSVLDRYDAENEAKLFRHNDDGSRIINATTGAPMRTEMGNAYESGWREASELGATDPAKIHAHAVAKAEKLDLVETTPQERNEQHKKKFVSRAGNIPNSDGTIVSAAINGDSQNEGLDLHQLMTQEAIKRGMIPQTG